jgi:hypothetical protein
LQTEPSSPDEQARRPLESTAKHLPTKQLLSKRQRAPDLPDAHSPWL